jgi:hypothetical protein
MRKTNNRLASEKALTPNVRAEQTGHTVDDNENVYSRSSMHWRLGALSTAEQALVN